MTYDEQETLNRLREEQHDAERDAREILLAVRAREPGEVKLFQGGSKEWNEMTKDMTRREREGFQMLTKPDFIKYSEAIHRYGDALTAEDELMQKVAPRDNDN
jgi:hypothetical protein